MHGGIRSLPGIQGRLFWFLMAFLALYVRTVPPETTIGDTFRRSCRGQLVALAWTKSLVLRILDRCKESSFSSAYAFLSASTIFQTVVQEAFYAARLTVSTSTIALLTAFHDVKVVFPFSSALTNLPMVVQEVLDIVKLNYWLRYVAIKAAVHQVKVEWVEPARHVLSSWLTRTNELLKQLSRSFSKDSHGIASSFLQHVPSHAQNIIAYFPHVQGIPEIAKTGVPPLAAMSVALFCCSLPWIFLRRRLRCPFTGLVISLSIVLSIFVSSLAVRSIT